jgi:hypothetical protein
MEALTIISSVLVYGCGMYLLYRCRKKREKRFAEEQRRVALLYINITEALENTKITRSELERVYESVDALAELGYDFFGENGEYIDVVQQCEEQILQQESSDAIERVFSPIVEDVIHANLIYLTKTVSIH